MLLLLAIAALGIGFVPILPKNFGWPYRLLVAPALGLFVFGELALLFSFFLGLFNGVIVALIVAGILALTIFVKFKPKNDFGEISPVFLAVTAVTTMLLAYIWLTQTLAATSVGLKTGGGGMYGDSALHAAYTSRLTTGEFPIQNPLFAGRILVYPFANDLLSSTLKIAGLNFNLAFSLPQILFLIGFLVLFYQICRKFTSDIGFVISLLILFLGWGVGVIFFLNEWGTQGGGFWQFLTKDYTDNAQYNLYFRNILTGLVLSERSFLPGLFLGLLMFSNFMEYFGPKDRKLLLINGLILGSLPFWHTHSFIFFSIVSAIFAVWSMRQNFKKAFVDFSSMGLVAVATMVPFLFLFFTNHQVSQFLHTSLGWQNGDENILVFWLKNTFLTIPLAILGFWFVKRDQKIFFIPAFVVFIIANLVIFQPWDWDNIKLLSWSFLFFVILTGFLLAKLAQKGLVAKVTAGVIILISIASGSLSLELQLKNRYVLYDNWDIDLANWAKSNTNTRDVFIVEPTPVNPISGLAGRLVYIGYPGHLWVHGIDYGKREQEVNQILAGNFSQIGNLEVPVKYIVIPVDKYNFEAPQQFKKVYQNQKYLVLLL
ncbi:hypothetical protein HYU92_03180 [Candidatus Curtissbacteria bacterium]|nr:hypothetical protein [Candidatus Curtissbacteria bacterium]